MPTRSMSGSLDMGDIPAAPSTSTPSSASWQPPTGIGSTPNTGSLPGGGTDPAGLQPGGTSGVGATGGLGQASPGQPGPTQSGANGGLPMGGLPGGGAGRGTNFTHERQDHEAGSITRNREKVIPFDVAAKYLANHEPVTLLAADGRQVTFRPDGVIDFGAGNPDETGGDVVLKLRFEAPDPHGIGIPFEDGDLNDGDFAGGAEIFAADAAGSEVLLGTYDAGSHQWTPSQAGRRWLDDMDGQEEPGRTR
jgi:hypothetical protein